MDEYGSILSLAINLWNAYESQQAHEEYAGKLLQMKKEIPSSVLQAEDMLQAMSMEGLPGKEYIQQTISDQIQRAYAQAQEALGSYPDVFSYLTDLQTKEGQQMTALEVEDVTRRVQNMKEYAQFLTSVKAPIQMDIEQFNIEKTLAAEREMMQAQADWTAAVQSGIGSAISIEGQSAYNDYLQQNLDLQKQYFDYYKTQQGQNQGQNVVLTPEQFQQLLDSSKSGQKTTPSTSNPFSLYDSEDLYNSGIFGSYDPNYNPFGKSTNPLFDPNR